MKDIAKVIHAFGSSTSDYAAMLDSGLKVIWCNSNYQKKGLKKGKITKRSAIDSGLVKKALKHNKTQMSENTRAIPVEISDKKYVLVVEHDKYHEEILHNMLDIITIIDIKGRILFESSSVKKILGYNSSDLVGKSVFGYFHKGDLLKATKLLNLVIGKKQKEVSAEARFKHKNGEWVWLAFVGKPVFKNNRIDSIIINSRDISYRKKTETEMQKLNEALLQRIEELERFQNLTIGRELRMVELKKKIKDLEKKQEK